MWRLILDRWRSAYRRAAGAPVIGFCLAALLASVLSPPAWGADGEVGGNARFLMISDLHFNPMADAKLVDRLAVADFDRWQAILESSPDKSPSGYGQDSNWALLRSALEQIKETMPAPAFVLLPGDFLAHNFRREFDSAAADRSDTAYRLFVRKTMQFVALQLASTFPDTPILPALGNNDDVCGDYRLQPDGPFLADTSPIVRTLVGSIANLGFDRDWESHGNYSVTMGTLRIIFPNTVFFSIHYSCIISRRGSMVTRPCSTDRAPAKSSRCGTRATRHLSTPCSGVMRTRSPPVLPATPI